MVEYLARGREHPSSNLGVGLISPIRQGARFPALNPVAVDEMEDIQTMEMAQRRLFREATEQKRVIVEQLHLDTRQMALLLHHGAAWQLWNTQKEEWLEKAQNWKRAQCLVRLARDERGYREEMTQDRGYWAIGVMKIQSEGVRKAIKQEEKRYRITLKLDCKEAKYRTMLMSTC